MNWDIVEGEWKEFTGKIQQKWGRLTDDELDVVKGRREELEGLIQQKYGRSKVEAKNEVDEWMEAD